MTTRGGAASARVRRQRFRPSSSGRLRSTSATSGRMSAIAWKPSRAVAAVAATTRSGSSSTRPRSPARTAGWSSTMTRSIRRVWRWRRGCTIRGAPQPGAGGTLRFDEAAPDRVAHELHAIAHAELGEDVGAVALDRLLRQHEIGGDLTRRAGLRDQLDDLDLARGERVVGWRLPAAGALDEVAHQRPHGARVQERL